MAIFSIASNSILSLSPSIAAALKRITITARSISEEIGSDLASSFFPEI